MKIQLKVLSYWNLNKGTEAKIGIKTLLKVLSYWNLNSSLKLSLSLTYIGLKYYHIGI